ncbi:MAG: nucleotidyltransferase family protein [Chloroflexi bacterium]|nr:nucleotidyltransferase family protein [Chloroflexota bacterium]
MVVPGTEKTTATLAITVDEARAAAGRGRELATLLVGAWRRDPGPPAIGARQLASLEPLILQSGSGGLAWWRIRRTALASSPSGIVLQNAIRFLAVDAATGVRAICTAVRRLQAAGIQPFLIKGWAAARWYPEPVVRPLGDVDLVVHPEEWRSAVSALTAPGGGAAGNVDLHDGFAKLLPERPYQEIVDRSFEVTLDGVAIRLLGPADHLPLLARHAFRHGFYRPSSLCDIAAVLESLPPDFDWEACCQGSRGNRARLLAAIGLAERLLGAAIPDPEIRRQSGRMPDWLPDAVLDAWDWWLPRQVVGVPVLDEIRRDPRRALSRPGRLVDDLRLHLPNPLESLWFGPLVFNRLPRLPYQIVHALIRRLAPRGARRRAKVGLIARGV